MKELYIDVETTGLDPVRNGIWQIAAIIIKNGNEEASLCTKIAVFGNDQIDDEALKMSGFTEAELRTIGLDMKDPKFVHQKLCGVLSCFVDRFDRRDKMHFVAYNARFDMDFMRAWFKKARDDYFGSYFYFPPLDVMDRAAWALREVRHLMPDFKLGTVALQMGIDLDPEVLHDALHDIRLTIEIAKKLKTFNAM